MSDNGADQMAATAAKPTTLSFDDLFNLTHTAELRDFPSPGQSRTIKFTKLSGPDQTLILETLYKIRDAKDSTSADQLALILEQRVIASKMIAKYLVEPQLTEEQTLSLNIDYVRTILDAIQGREKELGEGSSAPTV